MPDNAEKVDTIRKLLEMGLISQEDGTRLIGKYFELDIESRVPYEKTWKTIPDLENMIDNL